MLTSRLVLRSVSGSCEAEGRQECTFICSCRARSSTARAETKETVEDMKNMDKEEEDGRKRKEKQGEINQKHWCVCRRRDYRENLGHARSGF